MKLGLAKITRYSIITLFIISCSALIWTNYELQIIQGTHTDIVDTKQFENSIKQVAITNVNVLSPDASHMLANQSVLITNNKISAVGSEIELPKDVLTIDGSHKYLIPGLTDSHVHLKNSPNDLLLNLAVGVTHVYEMSGSQHHLDWKKEIKAGRLGSKLFVATEKFESSTYENDMGIFDHPSFTWARDIYLESTRTNLNITDTTKADKRIKQAADDGYDAIKLGGRMKGDMHQAISDAAQKHNIELWGHISNDNRLESLWNSNQIELAHVEEITKAFYTEYKKIDYADKQSINAFLEFVTKRSDEVAKKLVERKISISTTVLFMETIPKNKFDLENLLKSTKLEYVNPGIIEGNIFSRGWLVGHNSYQLSEETKNSAEKLQRSKAFWSAYVKAIYIMTQALAKHNALMMTGTDANGAGAVPGFSLLDELVSLNNAGLSNQQTLAAATITPNQVIKANAGSIEVGHDADLLLLTNNPLKDMNNIKTLETVFYNGHVLSRKTLDSMLNAIEKANNKNRNKSIADYSDLK